jgi:DNA-binding GntR family transcriptional regulator
MLTRASDYDSIGEKTYRQIRTDILFGKLLPGEKLKLDRLREDYRASVGTLRELLNRLATEGLVVAEGQRGFEVAPVSAANLREIAALRLLLESHALTRSFATGDMDWEGRSQRSRSGCCRASVPTRRPGSVTTGNSTMR